MPGLGGLVGSVVFDVRGLAGTRGKPGEVGAPTWAERHAAPVSTGQ
jgi:hypothetical protein